MKKLGSVGNRKHTYFFVWPQHILLHFMSHHITSSQLTTCHIISRHIVSRYITSLRFASFRFLLLCFGLVRFTLFLVQFTLTSSAFSHVVSRKALFLTNLIVLDHLQEYSIFFKLIFTRRVRFFCQFCYGPSWRLSGTIHIRSFVSPFSLVVPDVVGSFVPTWNTKEMSVPVPSRHAPRYCILDKT